MEHDIYHEQYELTLLGTFCVPGITPDICVYIHSHSVLSGEDDNCPHAAEEEKGPWRGSLSPWTESQELKPGRSAFAHPCPHHSHSSFRCLFASDITSYTPRSSCTFLWKTWLWVSMAAQKMYFQSHFCKPYFAPDKWALSKRNTLRMPTESLLTRANKLPALTFIFY